MKDIHLDVFNFMKGTVPKRVHMHTYWNSISPHRELRELNQVSVTRGHFLQVPEPFERREGNDSLGFISSLETVRQFDTS